MLRETNFRRQHRQLQWSLKDNNRTEPPVKRTYASTVLSDCTGTTSIDGHSSDEVSDFTDDEREPTPSIVPPSTSPLRESDGTDSGFGSMNIEWYDTLRADSRRGSVNGPTSATDTGFKGNGPLRLRARSTTKTHID